jgi:hypothetical protein
LWEVSASTSKISSYPWNPHEYSSGRREIYSQLAAASGVLNPRLSPAALGSGDDIEIGVDLGFRVRKSFKIAPGVRMTVTPKSIG